MAIAMAKINGNDNGNDNDNINSNYNKKISVNPFHLSNPCTHQKPTNTPKDCFTNSQSLSLPKFSYKWLHSNNLIFQFRYKKL